MPPEPPDDTPYPIIPRLVIISPGTCSISVGNTLMRRELLLSYHRHGLWQMTGVGGMAGACYRYLLKGQAVGNHAIGMDGKRGVQHCAHHDVSYVHCINVFFPFTIYRPTLSDDRLVAL